MNCFRTGQKNLRLYYVQLKQFKIQNWTDHLFIRLSLKLVPLLILTSTIFLNLDIVVTLSSLNQICFSTKKVI